MAGTKRRGSGRSRERIGEEQMDNDLREFGKGREGRMEEEGKELRVGKGTLS